jgi:hypothetical protein
VGAGAIVLLASTFLLTWYGLSGALAPTAERLGLSTSLTGWSGLSHVRWLILVSALVGLALPYFQASRRAPAIPVTLSVVVTMLGLLSTVALVIRVVIDPPGAGNLLTQKPGAFVGLAGALAIAVGGYLSMRQEGIPAADAPAEIPTVRIGGEGDLAGVARSSRPERVSPSRH